MGISVVIPVISDGFLAGLLSNIVENDTKPEAILVIDNSGQEAARRICDQYSTLPLRYLPQTTNLGVNASWNLGLHEAESDLVTILNDDLILPPNFLRLIMETFSLYSKAGFVVPQTVRLPAQVTTHEGPPRVRPLQSREGGAFTIKKNMVSPIPEQLFTFYGDDWFFKCVRKNGGRAYRIANNTIFHYVGISRDLPKRDELGLPPLQCDRAAWEALNIR